MRHADRRDGVDFELFVAPHLQAMANLAARMVGDSDRDDVVQDALARAWRRWSTFDAARGSARVWLLAIVADQCRQRWRRGGRAARRPPDAALAEVPGTDAAAAVEVRMDVKSAVSRLPERQRMTVELVYFVGLSVSETAVVLRCAEGTVKSALFDARRNLQRSLEASDGH